MKEFKNIAVKVDGSVTGANRDKAVQAFQNDDNIRLFIGNINAAGVGLTLTAASSVAFIELPWSPALLDQAEDRCHRIGQKDTVNIYYLLGVDTIEERIVKMLDSKRKILDTVLDGKLPVQRACYLNSSNLMIKYYNLKDKLITTLTPEDIVIFYDTIDNATKKYNLNAI